MTANESSKARAVSGDGPASPASRPPAEDALDEAAEALGRLVESARGGDRDAFRALVEQHQHRVFRLMMRMLRCDRDTAADLTQEVFLRVHRGLASFDGRSKFTTWLHKIAINVSISEVRSRRALKRNRWTFSLDAPIRGTDEARLDPIDEGRGPDERAHYEEIAVAVRKAVHELPEEFRECVLLRDLQGLSYEEIGEVLAVPPGTVRSRIHRGRLILQEKLKEFRP